MEQQNYAHHRRFVPGFHFVTGTLIVVIFIMAVIMMIHTIGSGETLTHEKIHAALMPLLVAFALILLFWYTRKFAVTIQDRVVRSEENMRHFMLTGKPLDSRLTMSQIIALRFAGDDEYLALVQETIDKNMTGNDIKKAIKNWRADNYRV